jgi:pimeloyl-ACP methyl ester carboxylesterase
MQSHFVTGGDGVRLHVAETGNPVGPAILFIHGFSQCWLTWRKQLDSDLARDHRLVAMDIRGHGQSEKPADAYADPRLWADDVQAVISTLRLDHPVLVGWSYAGFIIADYLRCYGDPAISGINLVGAATSISPDSAPQILGADFLELLPGFFSTDVDESARALDAFMRICTHATPSWSDYYLALGYNASVPPHVRQCLLSRLIESEDVLRNTRVPVLVSQGERDRIVQPHVGRRHAELIPDARLSMYPDAGHALFFEDAARFNDELRAFVASTSRAPARR